MNTPRLDVLICTFGEKGIGKVADMNLPQVDGVRYIVSWQTAGADPAAVPAILKREDIVVAPTDSVGSSNNRNHALLVSTAPLCLTADDDLKYNPGQLESVIEIFDSHPDLDLATFRYSGPDNKQYPEKEMPLAWPLPKGYYSTSFEVAYRSAAIKDKLFYNPYFGINSPRLVCADDEVFLYDCIRAGLKCRFFPVTITHHADKSSGARLVRTPGFLMTQGAYIRYAYGWKGLPRLPLFVWRHHKISDLGLIYGLRYIISGFLYKVPHGAKEVYGKV